MQPLCYQINQLGWSSPLCRDLIHSLQALGKEIELQLTSKNISIEITCKKSEKEYVTTFDLTEVPDNNTLGTQLDAVPSTTEEAEEIATIPVHVKVSDPIDDQTIWCFSWD